MTEQDNAHIVSAEILNDDYDSPWKDAVEHYFPDFMAFYFPEAYDCFDWSLGYTFLLINWRNSNIKMAMKAGSMCI
jgi:hypothetical protein